MGQGNVGRWAIVGVGGCGSWWMVAVVGVVVCVVWVVRLCVCVCVCVCARDMSDRVR